MTWMGRWWRRAALDHDLSRELQDHVDRRVRDLVATGVDPLEARRRARLEIGGIEQVTESVRDVRGTRWAHDLAQDVRYGARALRRSPGLLFAALLSMGLGIGANAAIFSLVDAVLLRSLPVRDPGRLVKVRGGDWTNPIWEAVRDRAGSRMAGTLAWGTERLDLSGGGEIDPVDAIVASGGFFETLGVTPVVGRLLGPGDDRRGGGPDGPTVVLSHAFWQRRFQGDPAVVGRTLAINQVPLTIVGVAPPRFHGLMVGRTFDIAVPIATMDVLRPGQGGSVLDARSTWWLQIMLRLRPGQTIDEATATLRGVQPQVRAAAMPADLPAERQAQFLAEAFSLDPAPAGRSALRQQYREPLLVLMGIVGLVLLVACANVANLLLARAAARRHELAARLALGASHGRLIRQLIAESLVLAVPGALVGLAIALWGSRFLVAQLTTADNPVALELPVDWRLLGFLTALSVTTAVAFGLVPAWRARRLDAIDAVTHGGHGRVTRRGALSGPLVIGQVALSLVLVVAAGLFARTFSTLASRDLGFEPDGLQLVFLEAGRVDGTERPALFARLREAASHLPGVRAAGVSVIEPISGMGWNTRGEVVGETPPQGREAAVFLNAITPGWFATYGTRLVSGRDFDVHDDRGAPIAIVNQAFSRRFLGGRSPLGRRVAIETGPARMLEMEVVGVVEDTAYFDVRSDFPPTLYRPAAQLDGLPPFATLTVRTMPDATLGLQPALTRAIREIDPTPGAHPPDHGLTGARPPHRKPHHRPAVAVLRPARAAPGRDRALRGHVVRRERAPAGDRHPADARGRARRGAAAGPAARRAARRPRHRPGPRGQPGADAARGQPALRARATRSRDDRRRRDRADRHRHPRRLAAGTAGVPHRARAGPARGVTTMGWWTRWWRRGTLDRDLDRELRDHVERRVRALVARGVVEREARRIAALEIGGVEQVKEACRDVRGTRWAHDLAQDVRFGVRSLLKRPGLVTAATLSLGLGIGANTAIFSLVDAVLLRGLPVRDPDSLVMVNRSWTNPIWKQVQSRAGSFFDGAVAWSDDWFDLSRGGQTDAVDGLFVSGTFFETLGVQPALGRLLTAADDRRGGGADGPTAVISHRFWQLRYDSDPSVIGRTLVLDRVPVMIVGVVPARFLGPTIGKTFDVAVPIGLADRLRPGAQQSLLDGRSHWWLETMFRLRPGQTIEAATAALRSVQPAVRAATIPQRWGPADQASYLTAPFTLEPASTGRSELRTQYRQPLLVLMGMVGVVLLIACANVANLLLARGEARRHELSARLALGASQGRVVRQLLTESVLLVIPGTVLGLGLAVWGSQLLVTQLATSESSVTLALPLDWRLLGFLAALGITTGIGFGLVPAWRARRISASDVIAHATAARITRRGTVSGPLVVAQVALSLVLVVAAGLFGRTFTSLAARDLGFRPEGLMQASLEIGRTPMARRGEVLARVRDAVGGVAGVQAAGVSSIEPLGGIFWTETLELPGAHLAPGTDPLVHVNAITPGWFATYATPLVAGRDFNARDVPGVPVAIVNAAFVRRFFGSQPALGRQVRISTGTVHQDLVEIVGVVGDAAYRELRERPATLYRPLAQFEEPFPIAAVTVRIDPGGASGLQPALTRAITAVDPTIAVTYRSVEARLHDRLGESRTIALLSGFFGGLALLLAAIGLYGVTSYGVTERRREIGIRLTLGASRAAAERLVLARVSRLVAIGIALGVVISLLSAPAVRTLLYELEPRDPATMTFAAAALAMVGLIAGWLPARRAARIDPARVLREG